MTLAYTIASILLLGVLLNRSLCLRYPVFTVTLIIGLICSNIHDPYQPYTYLVMAPLRALSCFEIFMRRTECPFTQRSTLGKLCFGVALMILAVLILSDLRHSDLLWSNTVRMSMHLSAAIFLGTMMLYFALWHWPYSKPWDVTQAGFLCGWCALQGGTDFLPATTTVLWNTMDLWAWVAGTVLLLAWSLALSVSKHRFKP